MPIVGEIPRKIAKIRLLPRFLLCDLVLQNRKIISSQYQTAEGIKDADKALDKAQVGSVI